MRRISIYRAVSQELFRRRAGLLIAALLLALVAGCSQQSAPPTSQPDIENLAACERISMTRTIKLLKRDGRLPKSQWATAGAIAKAESSLCQDAYNSNTNGSVDRGLYQINSVHRYAVSCLYNASCNTKAAVNIYRQRGNWTAWVAYNSGAYKQYLGQARRAVRKVSGGSQHATGTIPAGYTVNLRSGPGTNYRVVGQKTGGQKVKIVCHKRGTRVKGPAELGGQYSRLWDKLESGKWISDAWVNTGTWERVAPWCG